MSPRRRKAEHQWLEDYPGLGIYSRNKIFYIQHPVTGQQATLKTKDRVEATAIYAAIWPKLKAEAENMRANKLVAKFKRFTGEDEEHPYTFAEYAARWRQHRLGVKVFDSKLIYGDTHIITKKRKPISRNTQEDYARQCRQLEQCDSAGFSIYDPKILKHTRSMLKDWLNTPTHYNHLLAVVSHIYKFACDEALIEKNPATDIGKQATNKREVTIPKEDYLKITNCLMTHTFNRRTFESEWLAKIADLLYLLSSRPCEPFNLTDKNIDFTQPGEFGFGIIQFRHGKNQQDQIIDLNEDFANLIKWFQQFRRENKLFTNHLIVYPAYMGKRYRGKPVTHRTMSLQWKEACKRAGFDGKYWLADLRKTGLSWEFLQQGENDKGGHTTQQMRDYYRLFQLPKRAGNTLTDLGQFRRDKEAE